MIRPIFSVVIAALLMTGAVFGQPISDVGADTTQPAPRKVSALAVSLSETAVQKIQTQSQTVTSQQAIDAALAHAGLTEAEVKGLEAEYDAEAVGSHWDVDFRSGDWEYDYEVDAKTGAVTKHEKEYDPVKRATEPKATEPAATEPKATEPKPTEAPAAEKVTRQQAIDAALTHAGLTEAEVKGLEAEYDAEAVGSHWDVDFRSGDWEYDYEVDAKTGAVTKHEKEYDPVKRVTEPKATEPAATEPAATEPKTTEPKPTEAPAAEKVTRQQAIDAALAHAGLTEAEVTRLEAEYDFDDGAATWEVEFRSGRYEYSYELRASDGKILSWEKEYDD